MLVGLGFGSVKADQTKRLKDFERKSATLKKRVADQRRRAVAHPRGRHRVSQKRACALRRQPHGTQRFVPSVREDENLITWAIVSSACHNGRYVYRTMTRVLSL